MLQSLALRAMFKNVIRIVVGCTVIPMSAQMSANDVRKKSVTSALEQLILHVDFRRVNDNSGFFSIGFTMKYIFAQKIGSGLDLMNKCACTKGRVHEPVILKNHEIVEFGYLGRRKCPKVMRCAPCLRISLK